jgi:glycosyltransferase involved in cell wall biosynthesis
MKIGFLGNTNNYPFMLARAFRRMGHDVTFIVHRRERLHRPEFRYPDVSHPYPAWVHEIPFADPSQLIGRAHLTREVIRLLRRCDLVVLNELGVGLGPQIGRPYLALLTGSDLTYYCDPRSGDLALAAMTTRNPLKRLRGRWIWRHLLRAQRQGVREATLVWHFARGLVPEGDAILDELGVSDDRRVFCLMAETAEMPAAPPPHNTPLRLFSATRMTWRRPTGGVHSPLDFKGSDVMVRGLAVWAQATGGRLDVHLVRKGKDVAETVALAESLGLGPWITWHDEMTQSDVSHQYVLSDVILEQFGPGIVGMAGLDAMAVGRPVVANGRPELFEPLLGEPSPICQATTPEEIAGQLDRLGSPDVRTEVGRRSREWVIRHFSPERAAEIVLSRLRNN